MELVRLLEITINVSYKNATAYCPSIHRYDRMICKMDSYKLEVPCKHEQD